MKHTTKIAAVCLLAAASSSYAQMARKEVVLDTGRGGIELKVSVPDIPTAGPKDFSGNDGAFKYDYTNKGVNYSDRKVLFVAPMGHTGTLIYKSTLSRVSSKNPSDEGFTNKNTAEYLLKEEGLKFSDAKEVDNEFIPLEGSITKTYEICGQPVTDHARAERECAVVITSVTNDHLQSIGMMASITETNIDKFNNEFDVYKNKTKNAFRYMMTESKGKMKQ